MKKLSIFEAYDAENDTYVEHDNSFEDGGEATITGYDTGKGYIEVRVTVKGEGVGSINYVIGDIDNAEFNSLRGYVLNSNSTQSIINIMTRKGYKA